MVQRDKRIVNGKDRGWPREIVDMQVCVNCELSVCVCVVLCEPRASCMPGKLSAQSHASSSQPFNCEILKVSTEENNEEIWCFEHLVNPDSIISVLSTSPTSTSLTPTSSWSLHPGLVLVAFAAEAAEVLPFLISPHPHAYTPVLLVTPVLHSIETFTLIGYLKSQIVQSLRRLRREAHLSPGVQSQHGQHTRSQNLRPYTQPRLAPDLCRLTQTWVCARVTEREGWIKLGGKGPPGLVHLGVLPCKNQENVDTPYFL